MNMENVTNNDAAAGQDDRLEYLAPALKDIGDVNQITQSSGDNMGSDFSYS